MHSVWFGEFMGTLVLLLLGNGVNAGVTLRKSYAADAGWMVITTGWALARAVRRAGGAGLRQSRRANLNPAITLAVAVVSGNYSQLLVYWSAQLLGAMCGAALMALHYAPHWRLTPDPAAKLGVFCTNARSAQSTALNIFSEMLGTAVLVVVAGAIFSHGVVSERSRGGTGSVAGRQPGVGHRPLAGRHHRLRHQPRARSGPAPRSLRCCPFPARAAPTGAMRRFRSSATLQARRSQDCCCASRICRCEESNNSPCFSTCVANASTRRFLDRAKFRTSLQAGRDHRQRRDGCRLCAQDARAQRCGAPAVGVEERFFRRRPSAFGADGDLERGHLLFRRLDGLFDQRGAAWWCAPARQARCALPLKPRARARETDAGS